jgi:hypothetical protein
VKVTQKNIRRWLEKADQENATHVVVMSDDFSSDYYPINCFSESEARKTVSMKDGHNMQRLIEVYNLRASWEAQLAKKVCVNY